MPPWAVPAVAAARSVLRNIANYFYGADGELCIELSSLKVYERDACSKVKPHMPMHFDDGPGVYLKPRALSAVLWLNSSCGGRFRYKEPGSGLVHSV